MTLQVYHGTSEERAAAILREGFRLDAGHMSDPGDFGHAVYFTTCEARARAVGRVVLKVDLELRDPIDLPAERAYELVIDVLGFDTIHGKTHPGGRQEAAKKARRFFLSRGYDALLSRRTVLGEEEVEVAVYDPKAIVGVRS